MHRIAWLSRAAPRDNGGLVGRLHAYPLSRSMPSAAADINDEDARKPSPSRYNHERSQQHSTRDGTGGRISAVRVLSRKMREPARRRNEAARTLAVSLVQPSPAQKARRIWNGVVPVGGAGLEDGCDVLVKISFIRQVGTRQPRLNMRFLAVSFAKVVHLVMSWLNAPTRDTWVFILPLTLEVLAPISRYIGSDSDATNPHI